MAWPPATYDIISRNHSNWPSLNLSQNVRERWTNIYWKRQVLMFYPLGKHWEKLYAGVASTAPAPNPLYVRGSNFNTEISYVTWWVIPPALQAPLGKSPALRIRGLGIILRGSIPKSSRGKGRRKSKMAFRLAWQSSRHFVTSQLYFFFSFFNYFSGKTSGGVVKCRLFSEAISFHSCEIRHNVAGPCGEDSLACSRLQDSGGNGAKKKVRKTA